MDLKIKIFGDGADKASILELTKKSYIKGFTTNPTLMRKAGVENYESFAREILSFVTNVPISFEVFSDEFPEMERQARIINSWGPNVYVKIPITNTRGESSFDVVKHLSGEGVKLNVTAVFTPKQVAYIAEALTPGVPAIVSVFAGRVADTGVDPIPLMKECQAILKQYPGVELLWASPRELLNIFQADEMGCNIITVTPDILKKLDNVGYDLEKFSVDTVKMFFDDGQKAGYKL